MKSWATQSKLHISGVRAVGDKVLAHMETELRLTGLRGESSSQEGFHHICVPSVTNLS